MWDHEIEASEKALSEQARAEALYEQARSWGRSEAALEEARRLFADQEG